MTDRNQGCRRLLVISDSYPPEVWGGAELSLHEVLRLVSRDEWDLRVVALTSDHSVHMREDLVDGVAVTRVSKRSRYARFGWPGRLWGKVSIQAKDWRHMVRNTFLYLALWREGDAFDFRNRSSDEIAQNKDVIDAVDGIVRDWKPDIVHADNKDSILLLSKLKGTSARKFAMVRDNRFVCAHPQHVMLNAGTQCVSCFQECTANAPRLQRKALASSLRETATARQNSLLAMDRVLTTSEFLANHLDKLLGGSEVISIGNPHPDLTEYEEATADLANSGPAEVLFAGNLRHAKGPHILMRCIGEVERSVPGTRFVFVGRGPLADWIIDTAISTGMAERVEVTGFLDRISYYRRLARADVVVAPNVAPEPFGRLPLEAAIAQKPIVASASGGYRETVIDGKTGLLVQPGDHHALSDAIIRLLLDSDLRKIMGSAAYAHVTANFAPDRIIKRLTSEWCNELRPQR